MFAQIPSPPPGSTEPWIWNLVVFFLIVFLFMNIALAAKKLFGRRPPMEVEFATRRDMVVLEEQVDEQTGALKLEMARSFRELDLKSEQRASETHKRINAIEKTTARISTQTEFLIREVFRRELPPELPESEI